MRKPIFHSSFLFRVLQRKAPELTRFSCSRRPLRRLHWRNPDNFGKDQNLKYCRGYTTIQRQGTTECASHDQHTCSNDTKWGCSSGMPCYRGYNQLSKSRFPVIIYLSDKEICLIVCNEKSIIAKLRGRKDRPSVSFKRKRPFTSLTSLPANKAIVFTMSLFRTR